MISQKLTEVFSTLPPEAQQLLVENHLAGLADLMPKEKSKKIMLAATRLQRKYSKAPKLDLRAKKKEIHKLLDELARDAKISFIKERSNREELLTEIVHSLISWLNDIWSVVYEHNVNYTLAHSCLLFTSDALVQLAETSALGGCKCAVMNLPVNYHLKNKDGKTIKTFHVLGPQNIDRILLWIWRDLFVSLLAKGSARDKKKVPEFLEDIETVLSARSLERLLYGGRSVHEDEEERDEEEENDDFDRDLEDDAFDLFGSDYPCDEEDDEDEYDDEDGYDTEEGVGCTCNLHASYWSPALNEQRLTLRDAVEKRLFESFRAAPSVELNGILLAITHDAFETETRISNILSEVAGDSAENVAAALEIYISNNQPFRIASLLNTHSYLLRPRDAVTLQCAVAALHSSAFQPRSLEIMEKELEDCVRAIHASVRACFAHIEDKTNKKELSEILKLRSGSDARKDRVREWVEKVITPSNGAANFVAFAAMMVGFPMMPGAEDDDDGDVLSYVDLDGNDPDLEDLREEYRPNLRAMLEGWIHLGTTLKGGSTILMKTYNKAVEIMPWLRASDVSAEMANRLRERPNKNHVLNALVTLSAFAKGQRKKASSQRKAAAAATAAAAGATTPSATGTASPAASSSTTPTAGPSSAPTPAAAPSNPATPAATSPPASPPLATHSTNSAFAALFGAPPPNVLNNNNNPPPPTYLGAPPFFPFPMFMPGDMEDVD